MCRSDMLPFNAKLLVPHDMPAARLEFVRESAERRQREIVPRAKSDDGDGGKII